MRLSVIVPVLNEQKLLESTLGAIRKAAPAAEIVVVDGGSTDDSLYVARKFADQVLSAPRGRARQQNYGAEHSAGEVLAFVHADTIVPITFSQDIRSALEDSRVCSGRFDVRLYDGGRLGSLIGRLISSRSRLTRSGTGDQAIFVRRVIFESLGGFPEIPICEDVAFMRRVRRAGQVACLRSQVATSARRWRHRGFVRTILLMWIIKALYLLGVAPERLAYWYADAR